MIVFHGVLAKLQQNGWSTYRLTKEKQISNGTIARLRHGQSVSTDTLDKICELCHCQPGDLISYKENKQEE